MPLFRCRQGNIVPQHNAINACWLFKFKMEESAFSHRERKTRFPPWALCVETRESKKQFDQFTLLSVCLSAPKTRKYLVRLLDNTAFWYSLAFAHSSNCEERKEASNEDLAKHTKIGVLGLFGQTYIALPRYRSIHQTKCQYIRGPTQISPRPYIFPSCSGKWWRLIFPQFCTIRFCLVSVILGRIRSIWVVEVFVLKK